MIGDLFTTNLNYNEETMEDTVSEIINILSNKKFTISDAESIFKQVMYELVYKMTINENNLK